MLYSIPLSGYACVEMTEWLLLYFGDIFCSIAGLCILSVVVCNYGRNDDDANDYAIVNGWLYMVFCVNCHYSYTHTHIHTLSSSHSKLSHNLTIYNTIYMSFQPVYVFGWTALSYWFIERYSFTDNAEHHACPSPLHILHHTLALASVCLKNVPLSSLA